MGSAWTTIGQTSADDFISARYWTDLNDAGQATFAGMVEDSLTTRVFRWDGAALQTVATLPGVIFTRPRISSTGQVAYRDGAGELLVWDGSGTTTAATGTEMLFGCRSA